ncbi:hypothetical protein ALC53_07962 [Atta colombica]|uniref:Uncharacterized protein n=2 Tax=Atta colombica TaxID=520822 RepID=A0A195BBI4_9HYME|nr:hypothetical protein ALC53_07962 [Atta colombica]
MTCPHQGPHVMSQQASKMSICLDESEELKNPSKISGALRVQHSDLSRLELLIRPTTHEIFGNVKLEQL